MITFSSLGAGPDLGCDDDEERLKCATDSREGDALNEKGVDTLPLTSAGLLAYLERRRKKTKR